MIHDVGWEGGQHEWRKPYSSDLRDRVITAVEAGHSQSAVAKLLKIGRRTVVRYVDLCRTTGRVEPKKFGDHKKHKLADHADKVKALVKTEPDQTVAELQAKLEEAKIRASASPTIALEYFQHDKNRAISLSHDFY